ncbi:hypothetical protein FQA39_LY08081 [Lamprigera yunnana]|nr:hypothetical protein FQA39_LY08081 [Lamprigera yunnana]
MEEIKCCIHEILVGNELVKRQNVKKLYSLLSKVPACDFDTDKDYALSKIFDLINNGTVVRQFLYLCLLANSDKDVLLKFIQCEKSVIKLDLTDSSSFYNYCLFTNRHWLEDVIQGDEIVEGVFSPDTVSTLLHLKLIQRTNEPIIDLNRIHQVLDTLPLESNKFMIDYVTKLNQILDVITLCGKYLQLTKSNISEIYYFASNNLPLNVFSKFLDLCSFEVCEDVFCKLNTYEAITEIETLTAFTILYNILHCLKLCKNNFVSSDKKDEISDKLNEIQLKLITLNNVKLQVELLENIFVFLFIQEHHLNSDLEKNKNFYCTQKEVRLILMFLKSTCEEIKKNTMYNKASDEYNRFTELMKNITDGIWRMELVSNSTSSSKIENNIISYLLAPPNSLIHLSLKQNNFNKADQVIKIFNLHDSDIASEINCNANLIVLKESIRKTFKMQQIKKENVNIHVDIQPIQLLIENFFKKDFHSKSDNDFCLLNLIDFAITLPNNYSDSNELFEMIVASSDLNTESQYLKFFEKISEVFVEINNKYTLSIKDILCNTDFDLNIEQYKMKEFFYSQMFHLYNIFCKQFTTKKVGELNDKHPIHKTFIKMHQLFFNHYIYDGKDQIKYFLRLFNYLKGVSKMFYIENNNSDLISESKNASFFEILSMGRSEVLGKLLFERNLDVSDFEQLFTKLKLDLVYHVASIFCPKINLINYKGEILLQKEITHVPNNQIITYIQKRNWLLAYILKEIYKKHEIKLDVSEARVKTFINYLQLSCVQQLKVIYDDNQAITALQHHNDLRRIKSYIMQHIVKSESEDLNQTNFLLGSQVSTGSFETAEEIFEGGLKITDWKHLFDIINNISKKYLYENEDLITLHDTILSELVGDCFEPDFFRYSQFIINDKVRCECILNNFTTWPGEFCIKIMKSEMSSFSKINDDYILKFKDWYEKINLCENIKESMKKSTWFEVLLMCQDKPHEVLQNLLNTIQIDALLQFINMFHLEPVMLKIIDENYFVTLFDSSISYSKIEDLLSRLPRQYLNKLCHNLCTMLKKLEHLNFVVDFITTSDLTDGNSALLKNIKTSLKMLSCFTTVEQEHLWCLIADPSFIIETLIMNTALDKLGEVLETIKPFLENCEFDESKLSLEKIDEILRMYAEKSLEFRVVLHPDSKLTKSPESSKLLQSLDSLNFVTTTKYFVMPEVVPKRLEWVENYEVTECMCCMQTTFSMFNRRHHCRRCGRVICWACSLKRMQVPTYEDIPVRVCLDCFEQTHGGGASSSKSEISCKSVHDYWLLTNDDAHNQIVREEFSYEYAPSVSLCLTILKYHSKTEEYPKFLLNQCDGMLRLLQPVHSNAEIDYPLVIKMLKSLAVAAKMLSAQCMLQWGSSLADRILSQADLLGLLAERDCLHLIPSSSFTASNNCYIDSSTLRRLRDKLLELEQWNLALEVSTKAGLDNSGVFAAWGKSYLRAGSLQKAREKFQRFFDKTGYYEASTDLSGSFSHFRTKMALPENHPIKNPPLLNEIIYILESNTTVMDPKILKDFKHSTMTSSICSLNSSSTISVLSDQALCILNKLKNLNNIVAGNYDAYSDSAEAVSILSVSKPYLDPLFYEECLYYLTKYGSHFSVLEFFIKHKRFCECLRYMLDHHLSTEHFIDIYMLCLRENHIHALHEAMSKIDSTLDIWKDYLKHICRHLEKQSNLNSLYQLQQFMGDFVRAALTCIKFYKDDARTYTELTSKVDHLHKAQEHLQQELEQEQWIEVKTVRKSNYDPESYEAKGIANPSLVMKIDSKNIDKHINTISRQIEIAKFLADCESSATPVLQILPEILPFIDEEASTKHINRIKIPTLFGTYYERVQLAVLAIVCGNNVEDGFGIAYRIIHDHKLNPVKVYCQAGKQLAKSEKYTAIAQLVSCIKSNGVSDTAVTDICDEMLILAIQTLTKANSSGPQLDGLIKLITDRAAKISAYIESKQLKTAYLLAVKHKRMGDIRRILREAEFLNQPNIKALCQKILHSHSHSPSHSKD